MTTVQLFGADASVEAVVSTLSDLARYSAAELPVCIHVDATSVEQIRQSLVCLPHWQFRSADQVSLSKLDVPGQHLWLSAGVRLSPGWDARLLATAEQVPRSAAVSVPLLIDDPHWPAADRQHLAQASGTVWATNALSPFLALLRPDLIPRELMEQPVASLADRQVLGALLDRSGVSLGLVDDQLAGWGGAPQDRTAWPSDVVLDATHLHQAAPDQSIALRPLDLWPDWHNGKPVLLHVMHGWGGGQAVWVEDFCRADTAHAHLWLVPVGGHDNGIFDEIALHMPGRDDPLYRWRFNAPIKATAVSHPEYRTLLAEVCRLFLVDAVLVSSLIGHALDVLDTGLPTTQVCHEYYPFCPAFYIRNQSVCQHCDDARLKDCLANNPASWMFSHLSGAAWVAIRREYLHLVGARGVRLLAPSDSVPRHYQSLAPALVAHGFTIIGHGMDWTPATAQPLGGESRSLPRVIVLGRIYEAKGKANLDILLPRIAEKVEIILLGCGSVGQEYAHLPNIVLVPSYERAELPALLAKYQPDLGLLLSIVPETFSYTLSELMCAGIPALAPALGSFVDRIVDGENGFLAQPSIAAIEARLWAVLADQSQLQKVADHLRAQPWTSLQDMVAAYLPLLPSKPLQGGYQPGLRCLAPLSPVVALADTAQLDAMQFRLQNAPLDNLRMRPWQRRLAAWVLRQLVRVINRLQRMATGRS